MLALFTVLTVSVTSVTASVILTTSQLMHVASEPRWTFWAITGMLGFFPVSTDSCNYLFAVM